MGRPREGSGAARTLLQTKMNEKRRPRGGLGGTDMKRVYKLEDLDCANCAAKMERAINKIDGVQSASVSFMAQRLSVEADEARFEEIMDKIERTCKRVEPDCRIVR